MVTQEIIEECTTLLFLAWLGEKIAGAKLFKKYAKKSPFLHEKLHNYFLGGIHDMAAWTNEIWSHTETMMEHGTEACHIPRNTLFITCSGNEMTGKSSGIFLKNPGKSYLRVKHDLKVHDVIKMRKNNGMVLYPKVEILNMIKQRQNDWLNEARLLHRKPEIPNANMKDSLQPYAEGGMSLLYSDDLPMGATLLYGAPNNNQKGSPQLGRVYLVNLTSGWSSQNSFHSSKLPLRSHLNDFSYDVIDGSERMSKFGWSMAIVDVNKDGLADLAVGAPSQGSSQLKYYGAVHIYFGRKGQNYSKSPDLTFHGNTTFENLGFALQGADIDGDGFKDLIIGSPFAPAGGVQRGRVDVVYANAKESDIKRTLFAAGTQDYEWLGYSLLFKREQGKPLLLLGAPAYRKCFNEDCSYSPHDVQQLGRVFIYDLSFVRPKLVAVLEGLKRFSKFGASLAAGLPFGASSGTMLAVGAPSVDVEGHLVDMVPNTFTQAGTVHLFNLTLLVRSGFHFNENLFSSSAVVGNFSGDRDYGGFGMAVKFEDTNGDSVDDIIIGAPFRTEDLTEEIVGAESGAVYIFNGGKSFPTGDATGDCASTTVQPCPQLKASRTFNGKEYNARFGSAFAVGKLPLMFISSPRSSFYSFHTGLVEIVKL
ncbi:phosphatidylinositol-glycan-specific phospholipase D-like isoform X2 [Rhopilema esculentum]